MYKTNFLNIRHEIRLVRQTGTLIVMELKHELGISKEIPACVPILMYHSVNDTPVGAEQLSVKTGDFEAQIKYLSDNGYTSLSFDELKTAGNYKKPIIITFDDGYSDNYENAYPILKKYNFKATIFIVSSYINSPGFLSDRQIPEMMDLISFQSHTASHMPLVTFSEGDLDKELSASKDKINEITHKPVFVISYPNGSFNKQVAKSASKYYNYAITTRFGYYFSDSPRYKIGRIAVSRSESLEDFITMLA